MFYEQNCSMQALVGRLLFVCQCLIIGYYSRDIVPLSLQLFFRVKMIVLNFMFIVIFLGVNRPLKSQRARYIVFHQCFCIMLLMLMIFLR